MKFEYFTGSIVDGFLQTNSSKLALKRPLGQHLFRKLEHKNKKKRIKADIYKITSYQEKDWENKGQIIGAAIFFDLTNCININALIQVFLQK